MSKHVDAIRGAAAMCRNGPMPENLFDETLQEKLSAAADALETLERQLKAAKRLIKAGERHKAAWAVYNSEMWTEAIGKAVSEADSELTLAQRAYDAALSRRRAGGKVRRG